MNLQQKLIKQSEEHFYAIFKIYYGQFIGSFIDQKNAENAEELEACKTITEICKQNLEPFYINGGILVINEITREIDEAMRQIEPNMDEILETLRKEFEKYFF